MKRLAVLISNKGTGTNLQAIIDAKNRRELDVDIAMVISDKQDAKGIQRAIDNQIPHTIKQLEDKSKREEYGKELGGFLNEHRVEVAVLAGFMTILPPSYFETFKGVTLNIHPGLVPDTQDSVFYFPDGTEAPWNRGFMTEKAVKNFLGLRYAGSTIHIVTKETDFGPVLERRVIPVLPSDTVDRLYDRLKKEEHAGLINALRGLSLREEGNRRHIER